MEYRRLGRTGLQVSVVGLGTEYLHRKSPKTVVSVVQEALDHGVNYLDLVFAFSEYRDNLGAALRGRRDQVVLAGHICCAESDGHYRVSRDVAECQELFQDLLRRLGTDHVDILFIQMINHEQTYEEVTRPGGLLQMAERLKAQGQTRFIGMSGHKTPAALRGIRGGEIDAWMFPMNIAWDLMPGRGDVAQACLDADVGLVAMKPFAGGRIFHAQEGLGVTPVKALHYLLTQPGVAAAVPGVKNLAELHAVLRYAEATDEEKGFRPLLAALQEDVHGNCVYCNHCLPCPVGIDIGAVMRRLDRALRTEQRQGSSFSDRIGFYYPPRIRPDDEQTDGSGAGPEGCVECGVCAERCPFEVDVMTRMRMAAEVLR